jgi:hypothetical protein
VTLPLLRRWARPAAGSRARAVRALGGIAAVVLLSTLALTALTAQQERRLKNGRLNLPEQIPGLVTEVNPGVRDTVDGMRATLAAGIPMTTTAGAVYADAEGASRSVIFAAGTGVLASPSDALSRAFRLIADRSGPVSDVHDVAAGPLGGVMRCGTTQTSASATSTCGWADRHTLGIAVFPNRPVEQSAALLRSLRQAVRH